MAIEKFCTRCGKKFLAVGREVICPSCKAQAAEDAKKAAVLKAKRASWAGESVPVRISGRASTVIREYGAANNLPFAAALDALLKASDYFKGVGCQWEDITPYKSRRRDKQAAGKPQETAQDEQDAPQAAKQASKATTSKASASKASTSKTAGKAASTSKRGERKA